MRGQIQQMFIFLAAVLVIGATIFLGMRLIGGLTPASCKAHDVEFQREIKDVFDENSAFGSRNSVELSKPCDAVALCFVDVGAIGNASFVSSDPTIRTVVQGGSMTNVFLQGRDGTTPVGFDERIILRDPGALRNLTDLCVPAVGGKFTFTTIGHGRYIGIRS